MPGSRYVHVLRRTGMARLLAPTLVARIPDAVAGTAIIVVARSVTGSYSAAGLAAGAFGAGTAVSAPLTGRALDRLGQRRVLPPLAAGFAAALAFIALDSGHLGAGAVTALAAAAGLARPPVEAALRAQWPRLVPRADLDAAYSLDSTVQELIWIGGPLLLAVLLASGRPQLPLLACGSLSASVQRAVPAEGSTEAFAWIFTVITVGMSAGSACGGVIIQTASTQAAFLAAGGSGLAGAVFGALRLPARRHRQPDLKP